MAAPATQPHAPEVQAALSRLSAVIERSLARVIAQEKAGAAPLAPARVTEGGQRGEYSTSGHPTP